MNAKFARAIVMAAIVTLVFAVSGWARAVEPAEARTVAENWIDYILKNDGSWGAYKDAEAARIEPFFVRGELVGFVVGVAPEGFVLVPADDRLPPVKAYSTDSMFNPESRGFEDWMGKELEILLKAMRSESGEGVRFHPINQRLWSWLRDTYDLESGPVVSAVAPPYLMTTLWDQMEPYNLLCPEVDGKKCPVGCVATAQTQVMRYWSWPPQGTGSHSYNWRGQTLTADFNHPYDWSLMPESLGPFSGATDEEEYEVARLSYEAAVSVNMSFHPDGSGSYTDRAASSLKDYFYYQDETAYERYSGDDESWFNLFKEDLDKGMPCLLGIQGSWGGHEVVVDGFRTDQGNMLHLNMGWSGSGNAYYALNNINGFEYKDWQDCVHKIRPTELQPAGAASAASPMGGKAPVTVSFAGQGKRGAGPYTYSWDFGDGIMGEGQFPTHVYQQPGVYTVTLTIADSQGQSATDSHLSIKVSSSTGLSAAAQASVTSGQAPLAVTFTAVAQGGTPSYSYIWNFGDGASETTSNTTISHTYTTAGTFTATLTVKDSVGQQTTAYAPTITVAPAVPPPVISSVTKLTSPFRLKVMGSNFLPAAKVKINGVAVSQTLFKNSTKLVAKGADVKAMCPKGVTVKVTVDNGDGTVSAEFPYTR